MSRVLALSRTVPRELQTGDLESWRSPLTSLKPGDDDPVLFLVPGIGGLAFELCALCRHLRFPGAVYAVQPRGLDGREAPLRRTDELVRHNLAVMRARQPHGPFLLAGYSWGGVIAMEMARQLFALGELVSFIGMIEAQLPDPVWPASARLEYLLRRTSYHLATVRNMRFRQIPRYLTDRVRPIAGRLGGMLGRPTEWSPYRQTGLPNALQQVRDAAIEAFAAYRPEPFHGHVTYFKSQRGDPLSCDQMKVWPRFLPQLEVRTIPGDHARMIREPTVRILAEEMSDALRRQMKS